MSLLPRAGHLVPLLTLVACASWATNWVKVKDPGYLPMEIGKIQSALWVDYLGGDGDDGYGTAMLVMSDEELDCDDLLEQLGGYYWLSDDDSFISDGNGLLMLWTWWRWDDDNAGYEGTYASGGYGYAYAYSDDGQEERRLGILPFGNGMLWTPLGAGQGFGVISSHDDDEVIGRFDTDLVDGGFTAEHCGQLTGNDYYYYYYDDDEDWEDSGR